MLCNLLLLACKWVQATHPTDSPARSFKRKLHGLRLMALVLDRSEGFFLSSAGCVFLLRSVLLPSLLSCALISFSTGDRLFKGVLGVFTSLCDRALPFLAPELGVLLEHALLPLLEANFANIKQKQRILEMMVSKRECEHRCTRGFDAHSRSLTFIVCACAMLLFLYFSVISSVRLVT